MSLIVNNVINASSNISYSYNDTNEIFGYLVNFNYTIRVQDVNFDNDDGVLLTGRAALRAAYKQRNITARIAGDEIHNGLIVNMSFPEGSLNGQEDVSLTIQERRRLSSYSSKTFSKYIPSPHLISDFSETYDFKRSGSTYSYTRNISIQYAQDAGDQFLTNAKVFLTNYYYENRPAFGYYEDGISENARFDSAYNGKLTESIDLVKLSVSLQESFESSFIDADENVSKVIRTRESVGPDGYLEKTITANLTALRLDSSKVLQDSIASTIDEIIAAEQTSFGDPFVIQKGINKDQNKASISIQFSTNPTRSQEDVVTYSCEKRKDGDYSNYSLNINYKSRGKNVSTRYANVITLWESERENNKSKVLGLFEEATSIYEKSRSANISRSDGTVSENILFTTQDAYDSESLPEGISKYTIEVSKNERVARSRQVIDLTNLKEKLVTSNLQKLGSATVTATAVATPDRGHLFAKNFLNASAREAEMNAALEETTYYGTSDQITVDLATGTTTRVIQYIIA